MFNVPDTFVVFDLEWTAWAGSQERGWSAPHEHREVYDMGAVLVKGQTLDIKNTFHRLVTLTIVPHLPEFSVQLTGISQADLDRNGVPFKQALTEFDAFTEGNDLYNWGVGDPQAITESCRLKNVANPFAGRIRDIRRIFLNHGVPADKYMSSTIVAAFGKKNIRTAHQGLDDALNIVDALRLLRLKAGSVDI